MTASGDESLAPDTPPAAGSHTACTICLGPIPDPTNAEPSFSWPGCRHLLHLSCVANLRAHSHEPTCPACRQPWQQDTESRLRDLCNQHGIIIPDPVVPQAAPGGTHLHRQPGPPQGILGLCCPRLLLTNPARPDLEASWQELQDRHMEWVPRWDSTTNEWVPEWVCLRCNNCLTPQHPLLQTQPVPPQCSEHGARTFVIDLRYANAGWVCSRRGNPAHILQCQPEQHAPAAHLTNTAPTTERTAWSAQGPPSAPVQQLTNSWFYVPLLLAGAGRLTAEASRQWEQQAPAPQEWRILVDHLRTAPPVPWQQLCANLATIQAVTATSGSTVPTTEATMLHNLPRSRSKPACRNLNTPCVGHQPSLTAFRVHPGYRPGSFATNIFGQQHGIRRGYRR